MAEIKSTLDLVMERTKHLSLSKAEKNEQQQIEFGKKISGILQKYIDKVIGKKEFKKQSNALKKEYDINDDKIIIKEISDRLMLDNGNSDLFLLLREEFNINISSVEKIIDDYKNEIEAYTKNTINELNENLYKNHFISGNAILPNLKSSPQWESSIYKINEKYSLKFAHEKKNLTKHT